MADIGKAYVQIIPKAEGISGKIEQALGGNNAGVSAGSKIGSNIKKALTAAAIGAPIVAGFKMAIGEGAKLQQSYGGLDTIYGKASEAAKKYAEQAAKAGISANDYAEQAVSFGASLKQAFHGDTTKAVEAANTAILDMTDNAAKMGTPIGDIQHAYQGFAKQNYTMLDNLKLGYGGTKTEMERLLADAEKLTGQEYDISNLGDVYEAIHAIQGDLGLTGVAAEEASNTFSGSFAAMQASASNLGAMLATGGDIQPAIQSLATNAANFLFKNLFPMIGNVIRQLPAAISSFVQAAAPAIIPAGTALINNLVTGVTTGIPNFLAKAQSLVTSFGDSLSASLPSLLSKGNEFIMNIANGIMTSLPGILNAATQIVTTVANGISKNLPVVISKAAELAQRFGAALANNLPSILAAAGKLGLAVVKGVLKIAPKMATASLKIMASFVKGFASTGPIKSAMNKIRDLITKPIDKAKETVKKAIDKIKGFFPLEIGKIFSGLKLPHFSVSGGSFPWGVGGKGSMPSWSVSWYAKGGLFDGPSVVGVGESGPEAVVPLSGKNMQPFAEAIASEMGGSGATITNTFYIDGTENPEQFANRLARQLQIQMRMA